VFEI